nr:S-layer homology domain-containing protein [uncultured Oscillibacter sp.]
MRNVLMGGYGNGMFGPNDNITREQLAVMLWRYAGSPAATDKELHFTDADQASGFALEALRWAVENGIMSGKGGGILDPKGLATRAQTAQMLKNYLEGQSE